MRYLSSRAPESARRHLTRGRVVMGVVAVAAAVALAVTGPGSAAFAAPTPGAVASAKHPHPNPVKPHIMYTKTKHQAKPSGPAFDSTTDMTYHGGSVMRSVTNYAIFWNPATQPAGYPAGGMFDSNFRATVDNYFHDIGGTPYYDILTQYGDNTGQPVPNAASFGGDWVDTTTFPHAGTNADPLTDGDIRDSIDRAIAANPTWQAPSNSTMYFVYTGKNVIECSDSTDCFAANDYLGNSGSNGKYCAYHWNNGNKIYAYIPYASTGSCYGDDTLWPNSPAADFTVPGVDVALDVTSHEQFEANTDPFGDGWYDDVDGHAGENGDKCNFNYGPYEPDGTNVVLHGHAYQLQLEWSNSAPHGCVKRYGARPATSITGDLSFGTVARGGSATHEIAVQNTGSGVLDILGAYLAGTSNAAFSVTPKAPFHSSLNPGDVDLFDVTVAPSGSTTTSGPITGTFVVDTNDTVPNLTGQPTTAQLTATNSVAATATVGLPVASVSGSLDFGVACPGAFSDRQITVTNTGLAPLTISSVTIGAGSSPGLSVLNVPTLPTTLAVGAQIAFTVRYAPPGPLGGPVTGTVRIITDDPANPLISVPITGSVGQSVLNVSTTALDFGGVATDDRTNPSSVTKQLTLTNSGTCALSVSALTIGGLNSADFTIVGGPVLPVNVGTGASINVVVRFDPSAAGARSGSLTIASNDPAHASVVVSLTGVGLVPGILTSPAGVTFGPTVIQSQAPGYPGVTSPVVITDNGQAELIVDAVTASPTPPFSAPGPTNPLSRFAPGTHFSEPVTFAPVAVGKFTGALTVDDNDSEGGAHANVPLCGEGVLRGIRVLAVNQSGVPYASVTKLKLQSHGTSTNVNMNVGPLSLTTAPNACTPTQLQFEAQGLPTAGTPNQRGSYYTLTVSVGGKSTTTTFTLGVSEFKVMTVTVK
jgi:hypothetical protein